MPGTVPEQAPHVKLMKILHTADWHIGKRLERFSRLDEQEVVLNQIVTIADQEDPDLVLVAGDLFDTFNPSSESEELLYRVLERLAGGGTRPVIAIAGNHDSPDRIMAPEILARRHGIILCGHPDDPPGSWTTGCTSVRRAADGLIELSIDRPAVRGVPVRIVALPYANEIRLRRVLDPDDPEQALQEILAARLQRVADAHRQKPGINLLVSHLLFAGAGDPTPAEPDGERPIAYIGGAPALATHMIPEWFQYVACGHLHRAHQIPGPVPVVYSGSPLSYSFSEAGQRKYVALIEVEASAAADELFAAAQIGWRELDQPRPLLRHRAASVDAAVAWLRDHPRALVELTLELEEYLAAAERRRLHEHHDGIVSIIPISAAAGDDETAATAVDPTADIDELFRSYFSRETGLLPDDATMQLFREVLGQ